MLRALPLLVVSLVAFVATSCGGHSGGDGREASSVALYGVSFSPFVDGQDPMRNDRPTESQIVERLSVVRGHAEWVRTFGSAGGLETQACAARTLGFKTAIGAWLGRDAVANEAEIASLESAAHAGCVDLAIVGSETVFRGDLMPDALIAYVRDVRARLASLGIPVTTAERFPELRAYPEIVDAVDVVMVNYYPFWEGVGVSDAIAVLHDWHLQLRPLAGTKEILVSETGWPDAGDTRGAAVPSPTNAADYLWTFVSWARAENVGYFYFEAFDETWKAAQEGAVGAHWGVWSKDGTLKAGNRRAFLGDSAPDTWTPTLIDGPGDPTIEITSVSGIGDTDGFVRGMVRHVFSTTHKVAVLIRVHGFWWTKPYFNSPLTTIARNGNWTTTIVTGGVDEEADRVAVFLMRSDYTPPPCERCPALPAELIAAALARAEVDRAN